MSKFEFVGERVSLVDCCEILDSKRKPIKQSERISGPYPYYGANGVQGYINDYIFDEDLVLLAEDGGHFGSNDKPIAYKISGKSWVNNHAHVLRAKKGYDVDYICYSLMFYDVSAIITGTTRKKLTKSALSKIEIRNVSIDKQKLLVKILSKIEKAIEQNKMVFELFEKLIKARFIEMFGNIDINNKSWEERTFYDVSKVRQGLQIAIKDRSNKMVEGSLKYITIAYLNGSKDEEYILNPRKNVICKSDDILMTRTGNTGRVVTGVEGVFHNNFFLIDFDKSILNKTFLAYYLEHPLIQNELILRASTSTIPDLNHSEFYNIKVLIPPLYLQEQFSYFVKQVDKSKVAVKKQLEKTQMIFDSLMQEFFG